MSPGSDYRAPAPAELFSLDGLCRELGAEALGDGSFCVRVADELVKVRLSSDGQRLSLAVCDAGGRRGTLRGGRVVFRRPGPLERRLGPQLVRWLRPIELRYPSFVVLDSWISAAKVRAMLAETACASTAAGLLDEPAVEQVVITPTGAEPLVLTLRVAPELSQVEAVVRDLLPRVVVVAGLVPIEQVSLLGPEHVTVAGVALSAAMVVSAVTCGIAMRSLSTCTDMPGWFPLLLVGPLLWAVFVIGCLRGARDVLSSPPFIPSVLFGLLSSFFLPLLLLLTLNVVADPGPSVAFEVPVVSSRKHTTPRGKYTSSTTSYYAVLAHWRDPARVCTIEVTEEQYRSFRPQMRATLRVSPGGMGSELLRDIELLPPPGSSAPAPTPTAR